MQAVAYQQGKGDMDILNEVKLVKHLSAEKTSLANRLDTLINVIPSGVIILNEAGIVSDANPYAVALLDKPLIGKSWLSVIDEVFAPQTDDGHEISLVNGKRVRIQTNSLAPEPGQLVLITDMTQTRALQDRLNHKEKLEALGEMAAKMAHQLRTPIATSVLYARHLQMDDLAEGKRQQYAEKILNCLHHLELQIKDMLLFSRGGNEQQVSIALDDLLVEFFEIIKPQLNARQITLNLINTTDSITLQCNPESLIGALHNLVNNSVDAITNKKKIDLLIKVVNDSVLDFTVKDYGSGMSEAVQQHVLQPFFTTKSKGTGLGLSVVQAVARAHNGVVLVKSEVGLGTEITIRIPIHPSAA